MAKRKTNEPKEPQQRPNVNASNLGYYSSACVLDMTRLTLLVNFAMATQGEISEALVDAVAQTMDEATWLAEQHRKTARAVP